MTLARAIALPPASTVGGGILAQAQTLPDGWTRGLTFATEACLAAAEHLFCADSPADKEFSSTTASEWNPYGIEVGVVCSTLGGERAQREREARAFQALEAKAELSVGYVLATGTTQAGADTGNPSLADATSGGTGADAVDALALLEDDIAVALGALLAWVHMTPARLVELVSASALYRDMGGDWRTPGGHVVVASPGYVGNIDNELVATTEVFAEVGEIDLIRTYDRSDNRHMALHEAAALAVFDPCFNVSVAIETSP